MTTLTLRQNRAGHWDIFADRGKSPVATFGSRDEAWAYALDLAAIRTMALTIAVEFEAPGRYQQPQKGPFWTPPREKLL